ncbi:MAG: molybdopterin-dependent oxidoreductase [Syntrophorhabdaceae bacterium]|nr:molybdopterin-dependent oxidoreductase [Syntrophorhabdaceae bacterium]
MGQRVEFKINKKKYSVDIEGEETLLEVLRDKIGLTGTKMGCNQGDCGSCTVLLEGKPVNSCLVLAIDAQGKGITTIEGINDDEKLHRIQQAFVEFNAIQCGFCTPGMVITAYALLKENPKPTVNEIRHYLQGNLCRCTGYTKIVEAVQWAALNGEREEISHDSVKRLEGEEKVRGKAVYAGDIKKEGMLVGKFLRSSIPHGRIKEIRTDRALSHPGVEAVITAYDFPDRRIGFIIHDEYIMAKDKVRYIGEIMAAVAAVDEKTAQEALELIEVDIEELPGVFTYKESVREDAPLIHEDFDKYTTEVPLIRDRNICLKGRIKKGDVEKGFEESDEIFEDSFTVPVVHQAALEPKTVVAEIDHNGRIHIFSGTARPFAVQSGIAEVLGIPMSRIQVTATRMGGHFGSKGEITFEPIVAMLALKTGKPVKVEMTREEEFLAGNPRHMMDIHIKTGVKRDGKIIARKVRLEVDTGAYAYFGPLATSTAMNLASGPYSIPNIYVEGICAYTNKLSCGPCRGPGAPQVIFAGEVQLDRIARSLGIDPIEIRLKNALKANDTTATGQVLKDGGYIEALLALKRYLTENPQTYPAQDETKAYGMGIAGGFWGMGGAGSSAMVKLNEDGSAVLVMGAAETGAGSETAMAILVSQGLGIPLDMVRVISGDTDTCPFDFGAIGSRTTQAMGTAVHRAINGVKEQLLNFAEGHLGIPKDALELKEGKIKAKERPDISISIAKAVHMMTTVKGGPPVATGTNTAPSTPFNQEYVEGMVRPARPFFSFCVQAAIVQVDKLTGKVDVLKVIASHNVGKAVFKEGIEGQIQGGVAMGIGYALTEESIFDGGRLVNDSFLDYRIPTVPDVPEIIPLIVEKENPKIPEDIRGVGEPATIPTAPAIVNGVYDALGVRINRLPLTPERVFRAIKPLP